IAANAEESGTGEVHDTGKSELQRKSEGKETPYQHRREHERREMLIGHRRREDETGDHEHHARATALAREFAGRFKRMRGALADCDQQSDESRRHQDNPLLLGRENYAEDERYERKSSGYESPRDKRRTH